MDKFSQAGYTQALYDLGLAKEAGLFGAVTRGASRLGGMFSRGASKAPMAARAATHSPLGAVSNTISHAPTLPSGAMSAQAAPNASQMKFMEGLKSRTVAPQAPFRTMAERTPASNVSAATRTKNMPGYDPAAARLQAAPKSTPNIAQQNQFAGAYPEQATKFRQADQLVQAQKQTPILNSLFQNQQARPGLQEAMGMFG